MLTSAQRSASGGGPLHMAKRRDPGRYVIPVVAGATVATWAFALLHWPAGPVPAVVLSVAIWIAVGVAMLWVSERDV